MTQIPAPRHWLSRHWFFPVALIVALGDLGSVYATGWTDAALLEAALLFDLAVLLPCLYWWCYRQNGRAAVVKAVALACLAIWCTGKIVPEEHHHFLDAFVWIRYVGLAGLLVLEIKLTVMIYKAVVFSGQSRSEAQQRLESDGLPPWLAKFVAFEASLWRRAWLFLQRVFRRKSR